MQVPASGTGVKPLLGKDDGSLTATAQGSGTTHIVSGKSGSNRRKEVRGHMNVDNSASVEVLQQVLDAFNRHDLDAIMAFFAEDAVIESPRGPDAWGRRFLGKDQVRAGLAARFTGIPDVHYGDDTHWACGNRGVSEWTLTGTTTDGVRVHVRGCDLWEFRGGAIVRKDSFWKIVEQ
jgi:ketosteroid isomerase-like protein